MTSSTNADTAVLLDLDGTLVDTNYQQAIAWHRTFRDHGIVLPSRSCVTPGLRRCSRR